MTTSRAGRGLLAELLVVFVGVLVALAADSWWQDRTDQERLRSDLDALLRDLDVAAADVSSALAVDTMVTVRASRVLAALSDGGPYDEALIATYDSMFTLHAGTIPYGTLRYLVESGEVRLITDAEARDALIQGLSTIERNEGLVLELGAEARAASSELSLARLSTSNDGPEWMREANADPRFRAALLLYYGRVVNMRNLLRVNAQAIERMDSAVRSYHLGGR